MNGVGGIYDIRTDLFRGLELRVLVRTTCCRAGPLKRPTHVRTRKGKVRLEAAKGDILRRERVWCEMGVGGLFGVGTAGDWYTLGYWRNILDDGILGCQSARGIF